MEDPVIGIIKYWFCLMTMKIIGIIAMKIMWTRKFRKTVGKIYKRMDNFDQNLKSIKNDSNRHSKAKNGISKIKNAMNSFNKRLDTTGYRSFELKCMSV